MDTIIDQIADEEDNSPAIDRAVALLADGQPVALPTETVYGLAALATDQDAVTRIFEAKERPLFDPLIVHVPSSKALHQVALVPDELARVVEKLVAQFWPGPLTLILPRQPSIPDIVTAGLPTVAVRRSSHPVFARIIKQLDRPLAAPSANRFGRISPTSALAVAAELSGRIPLIIDAGACHQGIESTIIKPHHVPASGIEIHILRPGPITAEQLRPFGKVVPFSPHTTPPHEAPGQLPSHYAPTTPLRLVEDPAAFSPTPGRSYALLSYRGKRKDGYLDLADFTHIAVLSPGSGKLTEAAVRLFFLLRQLDSLGVDEIIAEPVPDRGLGVAIMDRLRRASHTN